MWKVKHGLSIMASGFGESIRRAQLVNAEMVTAVVRLRSFGHTERDAATAHSQVMSSGGTPQHAARGKHVATAAALVGVVTRLSPGLVAHLSRFMPGEGVSPQR